MIKNIVHDPIFLAQKSIEATIKDNHVATDLLDTLNAYRDECVGMAANMIGINKRIIAVSTPLGNIIMINPEIISAKNEYETEESCLALIGGPRRCKRYDEIEVLYFDSNLKKHKNKYKGWTAQIIQHEIDHLNGILI